MKKRRNGGNGQPPGSEPPGPSPRQGNLCLVDGPCRFCRIQLLCHEAGFFKEICHRFLTRGTIVKGFQCGLTLLLSLEWNPVVEIVTVTPRHEPIVEVGSTNPCGSCPRRLEECTWSDQIANSFYRIGRVNGNILPKGTPCDFLQEVKRLQVLVPRPLGHQPGTWNLGLAPLLYSD